MSTERILKERGNTHGNVDKQAKVYTDIIDVLGRAGAGSLAPVHRQSLYMIALKMSRIVCGDPNEPDHWRDIAGYATLPIRGQDGKA